VYILTKFGSFLFSQSALGFIHLPGHKVQRALFIKVKQPGRETTVFMIIQGLRMNGAESPFLHFMTWSLVKQRDKFIFNMYQIHAKLNFVYILDTFSSPQVTGRSVGDGCV
jgi:hypothetical protein